VDPRSKARQIAMQALFQLDVQGSSLLAELKVFFSENAPEAADRRRSDKVETLAAVDGR
jgi:transcription termination factor NusB